MTKRSCKADDLGARVRANYAVRVRSADSSYTRLLEVFWYEGSPLTFVVYEDGSGEQQVASVPWRHPEIVDAAR